MADLEPPEIPLPPPADPSARCPWCSAPVAGPDAVTCGTCGATLKGDAEVEIPGVTAIDGLHASHAVAPRKVRRTFGALFVGGDDAIPPPSQAELPALAMPDPEVRREMLRLQLDAELADLTARAEALAAERGIPLPLIPGLAQEPEVEAEPESHAAPEPEAPREPTTSADPEAEPKPDTAGPAGAGPPGEDARP